MRDMKHSIKVTLEGVLGGRKRRGTGHPSDPSVLAPQGRRIGSPAKKSKAEKERNVQMEG